MTHLPALILASGSPYRRLLLERLGLPFTVEPADLDETPGAGESAADLAVRLAAAKAAAVSARHPDAVVIGADQVAECEGRILGKPGAREAALEQLVFMSGRSARWHSAVAIAGPGLRHGDVVITTARFRVLQQHEIERYLDRDRPYDCAGSLRSESLGTTLLERLDSEDPTALVGLPLIRLAAWLRMAGYPVP